MATDYSLHVAGAQDLVWEPSLFRRKVPNLYAKLMLNGTVKRTRTIKRSLMPEWNQDFSLSSADNSANLNVQVKHDASVGHHPCIACIDIKLDDLLEKCKEGEVQIHLQMPSRQQDPVIAGLLRLRLKTSNAMENAQTDVEVARQAFEQSGFAGPSKATVATTAVDRVAAHIADNFDMYESLGELCTKLDRFVEVMDVVTKMHPYLNVTWQLSSALYRAVSKQVQADRDFIELVQAMNEAFDFVDEVDTLREKCHSLETVIIGLLKQTSECCRFIQQYTCDGFIRRAVDPSNNDKIANFKRVLSELQANINSRLNLSVALTTARVSELVGAPFLSVKLKPIPTTLFGRPECLTGTRVETLNRIVKWAQSTSDQNVFWLNGVAGSGKSTVSTTIARDMQEVARLGIFIAFERGKSEPSDVIQMIAHGLASFHSSIAKSLINTIEQDGNVDKASAQIQFEKLLLIPLRAASDAMNGPVVIVLDALDECGTPSSRERRTLLQLIREHFQHLPKCFRFLITSRSDPDIRKALVNNPDFVNAMELDYLSDTSRNDVLAYIRKEMHSVIRDGSDEYLPLSREWDSEMESLGKAAGGLFIWASTAVKYVAASHEGRIRRLKKLVANSKSLDLNELYATVLRADCIAWDDSESKERFRQVLGLILFSKIPLSTSSIDEILGYAPDDSSRSLLSGLHSVIEFTSNGLVRLFHTSFADYLTAPEHASELWFIEEPSLKAFICDRCFAIMEKMLRFNICELDSSHIRNNEVSDLRQRIKDRIPAHLDYACRFWARHLLDTPFSADRLAVLKEFLYTRLLFWLEVLSLLAKMSNAAPELLDATKWSATHNTELSAFLGDARNLVSVFYQPISESTPHIYLSALPLSSPRSRVAAHYMKRMSFLPLIKHIGNDQQTLLRIITGHTSYVTTVALSSDGTQIVSGSADTTIRMWDVESGQIIAGPFEGHTDWVLSVAISTDGMRVVSGSGDETIRVWDVVSGQVVAGPFEGHTDWVLSVALSRDGTRVVSGSRDNTLRVWDVASGQVVAGPFKGHTDWVHCVALSTDGMRVVSASRDKTIRVWNVASGQIVAGPFEGHAGYVNSVALSTDGTRIVSGSHDKTIRVWDVASGQVVAGPFEEHTGSVNSIALSADGTCVVSGSDDGSIQVWDVASGQTVAGPFEGHADCVNSVALSTDGTRVVSGSFDYTIRVWDVTSGQVVASPFEGHSGGVSCVAISSDGTWVVSGSDDGTIQVWDVASGQVVAGPFEGHAGNVNSVALSTDGTRVASGSDDKTIRVWDVTSGQVVAGPFEGHTHAVGSVALSTDGMRVVSGSADNTIRVWDVASGQVVAGPFEGHGDCVTSVALSTDGTRVVSGSLDYTIRVWDVVSGLVVAGPFKGHSGGVYCVAISSDGTRIVSGSYDETIRVWDVASGQVVAGPFEGHAGYVSSVALSTDGTRVVSGSLDRTIRVWDVASGQVVAGPFEGHTDCVCSVALSTDGTRIVSGSSDETIRVWSVTGGQRFPNDSIANSCEYSGSEVALRGDLSISEWKMDWSGWIKDGDNLLLWVPAPLHHGLYRAENIAIINCPSTTRIDFSGYAHGKDWHKRFSPI